MHRILFALTLLLGAVALSAPASARSVSTATAAVKMRAGPGTQHRVITVVPRGARVLVNNCGLSRHWCSVEWRRHTGWISGHYLTGVAGAPRYVPRAYAPPVYVVPPSLYLNYDVWPGYRYYRHPRWRHHRRYYRHHRRSYRHHRRYYRHHRRRRDFRRHAPRYRHYRRHHRHHRRPRRHG